MILVRLMGGLGNQMFQYAFGRYLSIRNKTELKLDLTLLEDRSLVDVNNTYRDFDLDIFCLGNHGLASSEEIYSYNGNPNEELLFRAIRKMKKIFKRPRLIIQDCNLFSDNYLSIPDNSCIVGRWQSDKYFKGIYQTIIDDLTIKNSFVTKTVFDDLIQKAENPVSIHIRRGDYVTNTNYNKNIGALDLEYYKEAIELVFKKINNPNFFIFSEDTDWCIENFKFLTNVTFVKNERSKMGMANDLRLITLCKHHIISNSTFSWWGAYLSFNENKMVIAPKRWALSKDFIPEYIIPLDWKTI